jgi:hypothetical protein
MMAHSHTPTPTCVAERVDRALLKADAPGKAAGTGGMALAEGTIGDFWGWEAPERPAPATLMAVNTLCPTVMVRVSGSLTVYTGGHSVSAVSRRTVAPIMLPCESGDCIMTSEPEGKNGASCVACASAVAVLVEIDAPSACGFKTRPSCGAENLSRLKRM